MIPIVVMILKWEKELEIQQQKQKLRGAGVKITNPAPHLSKEKSRPCIFYRLCRKQCGECS